MATRRERRDVGFVRWGRGNLYKEHRRGARPEFGARWEEDALAAFETSSKRGGNEARGRWARVKAAGHRTIEREPVKPRNGCGRRLPHTEGSFLPRSKGKKDEIPRQKSRASGGTVFKENRLQQKRGGKIRSVEKRHNHHWGLKYIDGEKRRIFLPGIS